jgi:FkbM family methyltransferase
MLTGFGNIIRAAQSPMLGVRGPIHAALGYGRVWASARLPPNQSIRTTRVGPWRISYTNPDSLLVLLDDIVLRGDYNFAAHTERPVIVDAGANIGIATLAFKQAFPEARVVSIEPSPLAHGLLVRNVEQNRLTDVSVHHGALASSGGTVRLRVDADQAGLRSQVSSGGEIEVPAFALSELVSGRVDFLKLDIEGSEEAVLFELAAADRLRDVGELVVEYHHHLPGRPDRLSVVLDLLERQGFTYQLAVPEPRLDTSGAFVDVLIHAVQASSWRV